MNAAWARTLSAPDAPSAWRVRRRSYAVATCSRRTSRRARRRRSGHSASGPTKPSRTVASARRRRPTSVSAIANPTLAWGVGGVKPAPPLALRRLTRSGPASYHRPTALVGRNSEPPPGPRIPKPVRGETAMDTSRRQFFQVTAGGLVAASGVVGRPRPVAAQGPTVKIGTAVLGDFSMVTPILVAQEKGFFRGQGVNAEFQPFRGGPDLVKAVVAGQIQVGVTGATDVPVFRATGVPIRFIASQVDGNHFTLNVAQAITSIADLKGKSIGVTRVGAATWA